MLFIISSNVKGDNISLDFESVTSLSDITDWSYSNFVLSSKFSNGTGSKSLSTDGKTSCYIQCDKKLDNITNVTFYISKETTNKNPDSYFKAEFSENGEIWTDLVKSPTFDNVTKGQWTEVTVAVDNKSGYIRISYIGTTAKRLLDDIQISYIPQTGPSITASDVTYAADITSGTISYTINNPVEGKNISASLVKNYDWITEIDATTTPNKVTFKLAENTSTELRTAQIKLEYEGAEPKTVTVTQRGVVAKHNVTWSVNGVKTTEQVEEGTAITFATPTENIPEGYVFKGWYGSTYGPLDVAPEYVTSATATADVTYYAVFAKSNGGGSETATLKASHNKSNTTYDNHTYMDDKGNTWSANNTELLENGVARYGLRNTSGSHFESPEFSGNITKIVMDTYNGAGSDRTFFIDSQNESPSGDLGTVVVLAGEKLTVEHEVALKGKTFNKFYLNVSAALGFSYIKVTYSSEVFTDFRTSVTAPTTATITLAEACKDGNGMYYGTYSNSKAFVVPGDMVVSEISVIDNKLLVDSYSTGAVVPANTGVMVSSMTAGDHEVTLSEKAGTSVLGEGNMLRPTGDNGITASEMAEKDADCKFYRLTMHKGTTLGYFWGAAEGAAFDVAANKAYLAVPAAQAAKVAGFAIDGGGTTAIESIENGNGSEVSRKVYNLQGQRVSGALPKGLYIIDGRKVIVK